MDLLWLGGEGPKDIPGWAYAHLVTKLEVPAEKMTGLRSVQKMGFREGKPVTFTRIYDPNASKEAWQVKDFNSLDKHPDLIQYEGYCEKDGDHVFLKCMTTSKP
jgi:hypothetical protein